MLGKDQYIQGLWEYFSFERAKAKQFMKDAEKEKQEGIRASVTCQRIPGASKSVVRTLIALSG